mmetsp:Transcript_3571/g.5546  ORF Transcript_3571/g.5546 Transcript_3571/m.5546 type:complete len:391 (+) Transcript_3571:74-1246(+)
MAPATRGSKKRAAEAPAEVPEAKKLQDALRQHGVTKSNYNGIVEAINHPLASGLTDDCRKMLVAMLPQGLCVLSSERVGLQDAAVRMLDEVYQSILAKMQEEIEVEAANLSSVEASKAGLESKTQEAAALLAEAAAVFAARKAVLAEAAKSVLAAKASLAEKETEQRDGDMAHEKAKVEKVALESALSEDFRLLRDGEAEVGQAKVHFETLAARAGTLGFDESLMTALPASMMKKPAERGSFDAMVVAQLEEGLTRQVANLTAIIANGAPAADARQAAVAAASECLDVAKKAQSLAADELSATTQLKQERETEHASALAALAQYEPEYKQATEARDLKVEQLDAFTNWNLACFKTIRDRVSPAEKKQKKADAEEAAHVEVAEAPVAEAGA